MTAHPTAARSRLLSPPARHLLGRRSVELPRAANAERLQPGASLEPLCLLNNTIEIRDELCVLSCAVDLVFALGLELRFGGADLPLVG